MGLSVAKKLIASHLVEGEMIAGRRDRAANRSDADAGRDRHARDAGTRSDGPRSRADRAVGPVRRSQSAPGGFQERRRPSVPRERLPAVRRLVSAGPATASATRCTRSASASRARRCSAPTATRRAAGAIGMLAIGAGGLEVALAMAGYPFYVKMPQIWGVRLVGRLPDWVSAKDVILEMLRRHGVKGGVGPDHRILRARARRPVGDGSARDRQHGRGTRRDHDRVSVGRRSAAVSQGAQARSRIGRELVADADRRLRPARRDRSVASSSR